MRSRIEQLDWMSPRTKETALAKLANVRILVGYPNSWRDYSGLAIKPDDLYGNVKRCRDFDFAYRLANLRVPVDPEEWLMPAQSVDAYAHFARMVVAFAAGYLQPPFFDPRADMAVNYGAAAAIMGHEITHHFDDQGRKVDATGALRDWWTPADDQHYEAYAGKLAAQFDKYEVAPGVHLNGKQTAGENLADIAGLALAIDAYHLALGGKQAPIIDGLTGDQRLFLAFAQLWRTKDREDRLKMLATEDVHSPVVFRTNGSVRNVDAWYSAFGVKPGDKLYLAPEERISIW
jgi:putative endopeptidase